MLLQNEKVLFLGPLFPNDVRVEHVVPSFTALTPKSAGDVPLNDNPVLDTELLDFLLQEVVLLLGPLIALGWLFVRFNVASVTLLAVELEPPLEAPDLGLVGHESAEPVPGVLAVNFHQTD